MSTTESKVKDLIAAIKACSTEKVATLLKENIDLELETIDPDYGRTPLLIAAAARMNLETQQEKEKMNDIIKLLLDNKANINQQDNYGNTVLLLITKDERATDADYNLCAELITRGANVSLCKANVNSSPLMNAIRCYKFRIALLLIEHGADVNYLGSNYLDRYKLKNALIELVGTCHAGNNIEPQLMVLNALLEAKADPNQTDDQGKNVLFHILEIVIKKQRNQLLTILLQHGANVHQRDIHGKTPIAMALKYGSTTSLQMMLEQLEMASPECLAELFILFAKFAYVEGIQKVYEIGISSQLVIDTFKKLGELNGTYFMPCLFGYSREYYFEHQDKDSDIIGIVKWFLKYMDFDLVLRNLKTRKPLSNNSVNLDHLSENDQNFIRMQIRVQGIIVETMTEELMLRIDTEFCLQTKNEDMLFLHPATKLATITENGAQRLGCEKKEIADFIQRSELHKKKPGLLPYWTLAERRKEFSGFKFSILNQSLKRKIMEFLEPRPSCASIIPGYLSLINKRLDWAQQEVTKKEKHRLDQ